MNVFRYVVRRDVLRMRWLAPTVLFLIVVSSFLPYSAPLGGSLGILLIAALILSGWMSVVSIAGDDPGQKTVVAVQAGGLIRARLEEAAAALVVAVGFGWVGLVVAALRAVDVPATTELATRLALPPAHCSSFRSSASARGSHWLGPSSNERLSQSLR